MARRKLSIALAPIVAGVGQPVDDEAAVAVLDAAADHLRRLGLGRWSVDDVADAAGVGRTSVYRWFGSRDDLVHAVLARELRQTLLAVGAAAAAVESFGDKAVEAALVCLDALRDSVVDHLLRHDPQAVLPLLTTGAGPLIALARSALTPPLLEAGVATTDAEAAVVAESLARLGLSFILTRDTVVPIDDPAGLRSAVAVLVGPLVRPVAR
ncbi:MAG: TetR/AcrR family transcriptional regulator [Acidimicrobiales bacterium]